MKLRLLLLLGLAATGVARLSAAYTYQLTAMTQAAFEDCYYRGKVNGVFVKNVEAGDTIVLPAGEATWGVPGTANNGTSYIILPITVRGQGDTTVIRLDENGPTYTGSVICVWSAATVADLKIIGADTRPVTAFNVSGYNNTAPGGINFSEGFRITNITYEGRRGAGYFMYFNSSVISGLIDNCRFTASAGNAELIFGRGPTNAWQTENTLGKAQNIFIEDCEFANRGYVNDANSNARMVVRYCRITGEIKVDGHGVASNSPARSYRNMEVYGNTWTNTNKFWPAIEMRGGTFMIFNNQAAGGDFFLNDYGYLSAWPNFGNQIQTPINYPIADQVGVGRDPKVAASEPAYLWNNRMGSGVWTRTLKQIPQAGIDLYRTQTGNPTATYTERDMIKANRDFFAEAGFDDATGMSVGPKAQMLASTPTLRGVGWWVTDEGEWNSTNGATPDGQLYTWTGSQWQLKYTPYPYPHPLRNAGAPSNVRINVQVR